MKRLFVSGVSVNILVILINFMTGILSARYLGPFERGQLAAVNRWGYLLQVILTLGLPSAVIFLGKLNKDRIRQYVGTYLILGILLGAGGMLITEMILLFVKRTPGDLIPLIGISMLSLPLLVINDGILGVFKLLGNFRKVMLIRILVPVGVLLEIVILISVGSYHVYPFIVLNMQWGVLYSVFMLVWLFKVIKPGFSEIRRNAGDLLGSGIKIFGTTMTTTLGSNSDQLMLSLFLSPLALGFYAVASSISDIVPTVINGALGIYFWPKLMDLNENDRAHQVEITYRSMFYGSLVLLFIIGILLPFMLPVVYGTKYNQSVMLGELLLLSAPFLIGHMVLSNFLSSKGKFNLTTISEIIGLLVGVAVMLMLLGQYGAAGAAIAVDAATISKWGYLVWASHKYGISMSQLFVIDLREAAAQLQLKAIYTLLVKKKLKKLHVKSTSSTE